MGGAESEAPAARVVFELALPELPEDVLYDLLRLLATSEDPQCDSHGVARVAVVELLESCGLPRAELAQQLGIRDVPDRDACPAQQSVSTW